MNKTRTSTIFLYEYKIQGKLITSETTVAMSHAKVRLNYLT